MDKIETKRLLLRRFTQNDAEKVAELCSSEKLYKGTLALPRPYTVDTAREWIAAQDNNFLNEIICEYAVTDKAANELYGCISMGFNAKNNYAELGYWIGEQYWGNGYATEAAEALIAFAFKSKGCNRVYARHFASNPASGRVMQKLGMKHEGIMRRHLLKDGVYEDIVLYGMLSDEYKA